MPNTSKFFDPLVWHLTGAVLPYGRHGDGDGYGDIGGDAYGCGDTGYTVGHGTGYGCGDYYGDSEYDYGCGDVLEYGDANGNAYGCGYADSDGNASEKLSHVRYF